MSHYSTIIIMSKGDFENGYQAHLEKMLVPYDENQEVEPYKDKDGEMTTYNPKSKWDWWRIGGRWDGTLIGERRDGGDGGFNFSAEHEQAKHNSCKVSEIKEGLIPFAIITPDGEWNERGNMGWWGCVANEKPGEEWESIVSKIYEAHSDCVAVLCDLHI